LENQQVTKLSVKQRPTIQHLDHTATCKFNAKDVQNIPLSSFHTRIEMTSPLSDSCPTLCTNRLNLFLWTLSIVGVVV